VADAKLVLMMLLDGEQWMAATPWYDVFSSRHLMFYNCDHSGRWLFFSVNILQIFAMMN